MPRRPKVKILSPSDPRLQHPDEPPDLVPLFVVQGIIRGLLNHCWGPDRRPAKEGRMAQETIEQHLLGLIEVAMKKSGITKETLPGLYGCISYLEGGTDHYIQEIGRKVEVVFKMHAGHTPFVLQADHDLLVEYTAQHYPPRGNTEALRQKWLKEKLPDAFQLLKDYTQCSDCRDRPLFVPDNHVLTTIARDIKTPAELVHAILGYFHCISSETVKPLVYTRHTPS